MTKKKKEPEKFKLGSGGEIPPEERWGKYKRIVAQMVPGQWIEVKSEETAKAFQSAMRRRGFYTVRRFMPNNQYRVWAVLPTEVVDTTKQDPTGGDSGVHSTQPGVKNAKSNGAQAEGGSEA